MKKGWFILFIFIKVSLLYSAKPRGVDKVELWLRADKGVSNSKVSKWSDQSGNGWDAIQNNSTYQPTWEENIANFNPAIYFSDHFLDVDYHEELNGENLTVFTVVLSDGGSGYRSPWTTRDDPPTRRTTAGHILYLENGGTYSYWTGVLTNSWRQLDTSTRPSGNYEILTTKSSTHTANSSIDKVIYYQGSQIGSKDNVAFSPNSARPFRIGKGATERENGDYPWHGYITETIVFSQALSDNQRERVESYLALKYGITLKQPKDYRDCHNNIIWSSSDNSDYGNDIAGVGLDIGDDCSNLDQRISKSINKDAIITMATNSDFSSPNPSNRPLLGSSGSFIIWSNNNGNSSWESDGAPRGGKILDRKWKIEKSGTPNSISIEVDVDDSDFDIDDFKGTLYFVHGDDLSKATPLPMKNDGNGKWHIDNIEFKDKELFSFVIDIPDLNITKSSCVISDPVNNANTPKRIPGAKIRYAIEVNNRGNGDAQDVVVTDQLSDYFNESTITAPLISEDKCNCQNPTNTSSNGSNGSKEGENPVKIDFGTIEANSTKCGYFEVEIK